MEIANSTFLDVKAKEFLIPAFDAIAVRLRLSSFYGAIVFSRGDDDGMKISSS